MDFGYDLLMNPQKMKPYVKKETLGLAQKNIELLGKESRPDLLIDMIEDDIVEHIPSIHTKIDNHTLREIIHISIQKYKKIETCQKLEISDYLPMPSKNIIKPKLSKPKLININPRNPELDITKLH
tara:strand:+ start:1032 stop:1409 length:378 start_codon:yes stop_codon:yes gene_type:complete